MQLSLQIIIVRHLEALKSRTVVEHQAFELFLPSRRVAADQRADAGGVLCPLIRPRSALYIAKAQAYLAPYRISTEQDCWLLWIIVDVVGRVDTDFV